MAGIDAAETEYERNQRFNGLVAWLHTFRYKTILALFERLTASAGGRPIRVVEIGCAHAKLFALLDARFRIHYTGIEIDGKSVEVARSRYACHTNFHLIHGSAVDCLSQVKGADVLVALETLEHIEEHAVVRILEAVALARPSWFVCSVPVELGPAVWMKNLGSFCTGYIRHREYTWAETFWAGLYQLDRLPPHGTGHKGFDWRWLAQTIRHNLRIRDIRKLPFGFLPAALAFSVFIVAEGRPLQGTDGDVAGH
jgi:hypothetical protein